MEKDVFCSSLGNWIHGNNDYFRIFPSHFWVKFVPISDFLFLEPSEGCTFFGHTNSLGHSHSHANTSEPFSSEVLAFWQCLSGKSSWFYLSKVLSIYKGASGLHFWQGEVKEERHLRSGRNCNCRQVSRKWMKRII